MKSNFHEVFFRNFFKLATAFLLIVGFFYILSPFILPVTFGGMLAMALSPFLQYFIKKKKWSRRKSLFALTVIIFFSFALPLTLFFMRGAKIINEFFSQQSIAVVTQNTRDKLYAFVDNMSDHYNIDQVMVHEKLDNFVNHVTLKFIYWL